jgi:Right handed beta helix region
MKTNLNLAVLALLLSTTFNSQLSTAFAQGSLTPPGAPAPTMKTLNQIEPRTPISSLPFTISAPGSYYVTTNLTPGVNEDGIVVAADNVTIDLNGFTLFGGGGSSGEGISSSGARANIVVRNGTLRNWPGTGVNLYDSGASQTLVQNVQCIGNTFTGIGVKNGSRVRECLVAGNSTGIIVDNDSAVEHCKVSGNSGDGIIAVNNCELKDNQSTGNGTGLHLTGTNNIVSGNTVKANADNYNFAQGNQLDLLLCQVPESIDWPAKVRLAGSLNVTTGDAITITTNNVTLDLNGFTISSTAPSATGFAIQLTSGLKNITIANGFIQGGVTNSGGGTYNGSGFNYGIYYTGAIPPGNVLVSHLSVSGCRSFGINLQRGDSTVVESCTIRTVGSSGIVASTIKSCVAIDCGGTAIFGDQASDCRGQSTGSGAGRGVDANTVLNCYGSSSTGIGVAAVTAQNCRGESGSGIGVAANTAQNCYGSSGSGNGLSADVAIGCRATGSPAFSPSTHQYFCGSGVNPYP